MPADELGPNLDVRERKLSIEAVDALIARVQRLIDSRSEAEDPVAWYTEASYLGDLPAIAALATIAAHQADRQLLVIRELDASREFVWEAWTTPDLVRRWWAGRRGEVTDCEIDLCVGGAWRCVVALGDGRPTAFHGEYREIVPTERIVATEVDEATHSESVNTVTFTELDGRTRLTLLMHLGSPRAREEAISSDMEKLLEEQMESLEELAASHR